jgi:quercetin dioxygenase-like cupin family protein
MKRPIAALLLCLACLGPAMAENAASVKVTPVLTTTKTAIGQPLVLPAQNPQVVVTTMEIAPGAKLARHMHPFARYAYVLQGEVTVEYEGGQRQTFRTGEFIVEAIGIWHFGTNTGAVPLRLLVIDQVEAGKSNTILAN